MVKTQLSFLSLLYSTHIVLGQLLSIATPIPSATNVSDHISGLYLSLSRPATVLVSNQNPNNGTKIIVYDYEKKIGETGAKYANPSSSQPKEIDLIHLESGSHRLYLQSKNIGDVHVQANVKILEKPTSRKARFFKRYAVEKTELVKQQEHKYNAVYEWVVDPDDEKEYDEDDDSNYTNDDGKEDKEGCGEDQENDTKYKGEESWDWDSEKGWKPKHRHEKVLKLLSPSVSVSTLNLVHTIATGIPVLTQTVTAPASECNIPAVTDFNTVTVYVNPTVCVPVTSIITAVPTHVTELITETLTHEGRPITRTVQQTIAGNVILRYLTVTKPGATSTLAGVTMIIPGQTTTLQGKTETVAGMTTTLHGATTTVVGLTTTLPGEVLTIAGRTTTIFRGAVTLPGETTTVAGMTQLIPIAGITTTVPGITWVLAGETKTIAQGTVTEEVTQPGAAATTLTIPETTVTVPGPTITLNQPTVTLPPETILLQASTVTLPPETISLHPSTVTLPQATVRTTITNFVTKFLLQETRITTVQTMDTQFVTIPVTQNVQQTVTVFGLTSTTTENVVVTMIRPTTTTR
jgi:hypothetical protein